MLPLLEIQQKARVNAPGGHSKTMWRILLTIATGYGKSRVRAEYLKREPRPVRTLREVITDLAAITSMVLLALVIAGVLIDEWVLMSRKLWALPAIAIVAVAAFYFGRR